MILSCFIIILYEIIGIGWLTEKTWGQQVACALEPRIAVWFNRLSEEIAGELGQV
jgi:hypothetical protein